MKLYLNDGTVIDHQPGDALMGYVIAAIEMTAEDMRKVFQLHAPQEYLMHLMSRYAPHTPGNN